MKIVLSTIQWPNLIAKTVIVLNKYTYFGMIGSGENPRGGEINKDWSAIFWGILEGLKARRAIGKKRLLICFPCKLFLE